MGFADRAAALCVHRGIARPVNLSDAEKAELSGGDPLAGIGQYMCGERWLFTRPIRAGDVMWRTQALFSADLKPSSFGGGTGALVSHRVSWEDEGGAPFAFRFLDFWHADRGESRKAAKNKVLERAHYTDEDLDRIDACYEAESVRGATTRLATDVQVGEALGPIAKGPTSVTEIVAWHTGVGWGVYGGGASRVAFAEPQADPEVLPEERSRLLGHGAALPLGRRMGTAHGASGGVRLRRHALELDGASGDELDG